MLEYVKVTKKKEAIVALNILAGSLNAKLDSGWPMSAMGWSPFFVVQPTDPAAMKYWVTFVLKTEQPH